MTELLVESCAHCLGHDDREQPTGPSPAWPTAVRAQYPGHCTSCGGYYPAGTTIRRSSDGWTADCCAEET
jgi:hypothetical protein